jgi:hypothetical protein
MRDMSYVSHILLDLNYTKPQYDMSGWVQTFALRNARTTRLRIVHYSQCVGCKHLHYVMHVQHDSELHTTRNTTCRVQTFALSSARTARLRTAYYSRYDMSCWVQTFALRNTVCIMENQQMFFVFCGL